MSYESEIKKLERRWEENPKQYFAPLADAHRKHGDYAKALDLIAAGLAERPNYVSAHIVLGRTRVDMGEPEEASRVFEQVLEFDAENIIALNQLAIIAEEGDDMEGAIRWLGRLLEVDPMNDVAQQHLKDLRGTDAPAARNSAPDFSEIPVETLAEEPAGASADEPFIDTSFAGIMDDPEPASADGEPVLEVEPPGVVRRPAIDELPTAVNMAAVVVGEPAAPDADDPDAMAELPTQKMQAIPDDVVLGAAALEEETEAVAGGSDPDAASDAGDAGAAAGTVAIVDGQESDMYLAMIEVGEGPDTPSGEEAVERDGYLGEGQQPQPIVTETMARVYAEQGMIAEAAEVYRSLIEANPSDRRLVAELERLEANAGPVVTAGSGPGPRYSVVVTGGTSARGLLQGILAATIAVEPVAGRPLQPFAAPQQAPSASRLSFDDFYGATGAPPPLDDSGPSEESPGDDDFKSWLKGLKS